MPLDMTVEEPSTRIVRNISAVEVSLSMALRPRLVLLRGCYRRAAQPDAGNSTVSR